MNLTRPDSLFELLPAVHRQRDITEGEPLRALLQIITEQARDLQRDIEQLYDNWFIETCDDWVVPYIADLVGFRRVQGAGQPGDALDPRGGLLNRYLFPRREVASTVKLRRRKGTLPVLEELARNIADWKARAVEFYPYVVRSQSLKSPWPKSGGTVDFRHRTALADIGSPLDEVARTVDTRPMRSLPAHGWHNFPNVALFVWQRRVESVTRSRPRCIPQDGDDCRHFTFDVLGRTLPLHVLPAQEDSTDSIAERQHLPVPLTRAVLEHNGSASELYYGERDGHALSLAVYRGGRLIRADRVLVRNLSSSSSRDQARRDLSGDFCAEIAVDPECGLFLDGGDCRAAADYRVTYHVGVWGEIGAGESPRRGRADEHPEDDASNRQPPDAGASYHRWIGPGQRDDPSPISLVERLETPRFLNRVAADNPPWTTFHVTADLTVELTSSDLYTIRAPTIIEVAAGVTFILRAADRTRPVIDIDVPGDVCEPGWRVVLHPRSRLVLDGLVIAGSLTIEEPPGLRAVPESETDPFHVVGPPPKSDEIGGCGCDEDDVPVEQDEPRVDIHRCTIFADFGGCGCHGAKRRMNRDALEVRLSAGRLTIDRSILGPVDVRSPVDACGQAGSSEPCPVEHVALVVQDSILDADPYDRCDCERQDEHSRPSPVLYGGCCRQAHARARIVRSTLCGDVRLVGLSEAEDSLFLGGVHVERRHEGWMRFCYVEALHKAATQTARRDFAVLRTPVRFKCQPESAGVQESGSCPVTGRPLRAADRPDLRPKFVSRGLGRPGYLQLAHDAPIEILRGAEDESELGAFHDEFFPQRDAALRARLEEFTASEMSSAVIYADDLMPPLLGRQCACGCGDSKKQVRERRGGDDAR